MKKFLALILTVILSLSAMALVGCTPTEPDPVEPPQAQTPLIAMAFSSSPEVGTTDDGAQYIEKTLTATVTPSTATQTVDWSVAWAGDATLAAEEVSNYITVTPENDGSTTAYVRCYADFGSDTIIITVATRDGGYTATCNVTFQGLLRDFNIEVPEDIELKNTEERGDYYQLYCGNTYTIDLTSKDMFGNSSVGDYTVSCSGYGQTWMMNKAVSPSFGLVTMPIKQDLSLYTSYNTGNIGWDTYYVAEINANNQLAITAKSVYMLSGNDIYITTSSNDIVQYVYYTATIPDKTGYVGGANNEITPDEYNDTNTTNIPKSYFIVTVQDLTTNITKTFKFWIESTVDEVNLDNSSMTFSAN